MEAHHQRIERLWPFRFLIKFMLVKSKA